MDIPAFPSLSPGQQKQFDDWQLDKEAWRIECATAGEIVRPRPTPPAWLTAHGISVASWRSNRNN